jgi:hypothetical protein
MRRGGYRPRTDPLRLLRPPIVLLLLLLLLLLL